MTTPLRAPLPDFAPDAPLYVVLNVASGRLDTDERIATIGRVLTEAGRSHDVIAVTDASQMGTAINKAVALAQANGGAVVAAGGDGTINAVCQAVLHSGCPLGVLPQGTFNYFGREHGIPADIEAAVRQLLRSRPRAVQVGLINDKAFLVNASFGLYPQVLEDREHYKQQLGRSRGVALFSGLMTLLHRHRHWTVELESQGEVHTVRTSTLFVGNNALQLRQIGIAEGERLADGRLAAVMVKPVGRWALLWLMLRGAIGQLGEADNIISLAFTQLTVRPRRHGSQRRIKVAFDGEVMHLPTPLRFRVSPQPLALLLPDDAEPSSDQAEPAREAA